MTSRTTSYTYAATSDAAFTFSPVVVTETDTVPLSDFSGLSTFLPSGALAPPPQTAGAILSAPGYDGLAWTPFSAASYTPGETVVVNFSYTVTSNDPTKAISAIYQAMTIDFQAGGSYITGTITTTLTNNGVVVGQSTATLNTPSVTNVALNAPYASVQVNVTMTLSVAANAPVGSAVAVSRLTEGYATTTVATLPGSIGDFVWNDINGDGIFETGEAAISGVTVDLLNASGTIVGVTTTDSTGHYLFSGLNPGSYQVQFVAPFGYSFTIQVAGNGSQTVSAASVTTGKTGTINLASGQNILVEDAGLVFGSSGGGGGGVGAITTHVYLDANGDSSQGAGETNLAGVTVVLLNGSGVPTGTTAVTDANGNVSFAGLAPGSYQVAVTAPGGDIVTQHTNVGIPLTVVANQTVAAVEGVYLPATFNTHVYLDTNGDGTQGVGETNLAGVTVALLNGSGVATGQTAVTDANGNVSFAGLAPGSYQVSVTAPNGDIVTQHTNTLTTNTLLSGQTANAIEGVYLPAIFNTHVYLDANGDSTQGVGETNLAGVTVALLNGSGVATGRTAVTDANGNVSFAGLAPGSYQVSVTAPNGDIVTQQTNTLTTNTLVSGQTANAIEGVYLPAAFNTHVYYDSNADGTQGTGETNLAGVTVALLNGSGVATGRTAVTDANGNVSFAGLAPGSYEVSVTTPAGTIAKQMTNVMTPTTLASGQTGNAIEGVYAPATFTTHVFFDTNANAIQDAGDTNLAGVTVALLNGNGVATGQTAITDANGNVSFTGLVPGSYEVAVTTPAGDTITTTTNVMTPTTLLAGQTATAIEGVTKPVGFTSGTTGLTIGYWKQHQSQWDGVSDGISPDALYALPNHGQSGPGGAVGVLLGDLNGNGVTDNGETTLFLSLRAAQELIDPSMFKGSDAHQILLKQLIAAQLNIDNGAHAPGWLPGSAVVGTDMISEAVKWLRGMGPFIGYADQSTGNVEKYGTAGVLDTGTSGNVDFNTSTLKFAVGTLSTSSSAWTQALTVDLTNHIALSGNDLANALQAFNSDGTQLIVSNTGASIAWGGTGTPTDVHSNTSSGVWAVLKDAGIIHG